MNLTENLKKIQLDSKMTRVAVAFFVLSSTSPTLSAQAETSSGQISVSGRVAVICRAELSGTVIPATDRVALGQLTELCNVFGGYRVVMDYPAALEGAQISVDGTAQTLTNAGQIVLVDSPVSAYRIRNLELDLTALSPAARASALNLAFRAMPKRGV
jgi:hypothetical protein